MEKSIYVNYSSESITIIIESENDYNYIGITKEQAIELIKKLQEVLEKSN